MEDPNVNVNIWAEELHELRHQRTDSRHVVLAILAGDFEKNRENFKAALKYYSDALSSARGAHFLENDCSALAEELVRMAAHRNRPGIVFLLGKLGKVLNIGEAGVNSRLNAARRITPVHKRTLDLEKVQQRHQQGTPHHHQAGVDIRANEVNIRDMHHGIERDLAYFRDEMSAGEFCEAHIACIHFNMGVYRQNYQPGFFGQKAFTINRMPILEEGVTPAFCGAVVAAYRHSNSLWQSTDSRLLVAMLRNNWVPASEKKDAIEKYMANPKNQDRKLFKALVLEIQHLHGPVAEQAHS